MKFDLKKFTEELQTEFKESLSSKEVEDLLEIKEAYNKDNPLANQQLYHHQLGLW